MTLELLLRQRFEIAQQRLQILCQRNIEKERTNIGIAVNDCIEKLNSVHCIQLTWFSHTIFSVKL